MSKIEEIKEELLDRGYEESKVSEIIQSLKEDAQEAGKSVEELLEEAGHIISNLDLSAFAGVESPAISSSWFLMKSDGDIQFESTSPMLFQKDVEEGEEKQISYAEVLRPGEVDKQDDLVPSQVIEDAAHEFIGEGNVRNIDINHDGITGKGRIVESYIVLEEHTPFVVKDHEGKEKEIPKGTWVSAVEWEDEIWPHIKNGDLQGFSIFGEGDGIELEMSKEMIEGRVKELIKKGREKGLELSLNTPEKSNNKNIKGKEDNKTSDNMSEEEVEENEEENEETEEEEKETSNQQILSAINDLKSEMSEVKEVLTQEDENEDEDEDDEEKTDPEEEEVEEDDEGEAEEKVKSNEGIRKENLGEVEDSNEDSTEIDYEKTAQEYEKKLGEDKDV